MKQTIFIFSIALFLLASRGEAFACEPCLPSEQLTMEQSVEKADLIIIGKRHHPPLLNDNNSRNGPETIEIAIERALKGQADKKIIRAASWYGMCGYGVILHKERALLLLRKGQTGQNGQDIYETVNSGCGGNQYILIDGQLTRKNMQGGTLVHTPFMSVEEFEKNYIQVAEPDLRSVKDAEAVMCTMDAKLCPDGSYVSRKGPNCEFTPCPE